MHGGQLTAFRQRDRQHRVHRGRQCQSWLRVACLPHPDGPDQLMAGAEICSQLHGLVNGLFVA